MGASPQRPTLEELKNFIHKDMPKALHRKLARQAKKKFGTVASNGAKSYIYGTMQNIKGKVDAAKAKLPGKIPAMPSMPAMPGYDASKSVLWPEMKKRKKKFGLG